MIDRPSQNPRSIADGDLQKPITRNVVLVRSDLQRRLIFTELEGYRDKDGNFVRAGGESEYFAEYYSAPLQANDPLAQALLAKFNELKGV